MFRERVLSEWGTYYGVYCISTVVGNTLHATDCHVGVVGMGFIDQFQLADAQLGISRGIFL